ncbi:hypothetical protein V5F59_18490 [Xanthobacter autotrophicus DSM 431]|uniref:hypothetical protein n=1 Tax=Xanthobacter nonsaccharivorans TaxID=3119912 RepID=UPI00372C51E9
MARGLRMGRRAYGVFVVAYGIALTAPLFAALLGIVPLISVAPGPTPQYFAYWEPVLLYGPFFYLFFSAARLADAGFRFGRSLVSLVAINFALPIGLIGFAAVFSSARDPRDTIAVFAILLAFPLFLIIQAAIAIFCLKFRSTPPQLHPTSRPATKAPKRREGPTWVDTEGGRRLWVDTSNEP